MAMTPKGIYFPEGTTNANFVSIFATLANSVDNALGDFTYDSGWVNVGTAEMLNGWETYNTTGSRVRYRKIGKTVYLDGIARRGTANDIFTLPVGFRPIGVYPNFGAAVTTSTVNDSGTTARLRVTTGGIVQAYQMTQANRNSGIGLSAGIFLAG